MSRRDVVIGDVLVLAAVERAQRHSGRGREGVPRWTIMEHVGVPVRSGRARLVRARVDALVAVGAVERRRRRGVDTWVLTARGRRRLRRARGAGRVPVLVESPQHRAWREAHALAERRVEGFRVALLEAARYTVGLVEATGAVPGEPASDVLLEVGERLAQACRRLASATYCLYEWSEPDDAAADIDDHTHPGDLVLEDPRDRGVRRARRRGRRNVGLWDTQPTLAFIGLAIRTEREQHRLSVAELASGLGVAEGALGRLEAGLLDPDYLLLMKLTKALDMGGVGLMARAEELEEEANGR